MKTVVITGSSRGIGLGMAHEFLKRNHQVVIVGRTPESTAKAVEKLSTSFPAARIFGQSCDVGNWDQNQALWDAAVARFGRVDIWINNAAVPNDYTSFVNLEPQRIQEVVQVNLVGMLYGTKVALHRMQQQGGGQIYNMEGSGSYGESLAGWIIYGTTKYALQYFTRELVKETKSETVQVCFLSPGVVITDMVTNGYSPDDANTLRALNIIGDTVETVTPYLVNNILRNTKHGARIAWLTTPKIIWRFLTAPFRKRDVITLAKS